MEFLYVMGFLLVGTLLWIVSGLLVISSVNFLSMYFKGERMFSKYDPCHPALFFGPLMFLWILYPIWLIIKEVYTLIYNNIGRTVALENIKEYAYDYRHKCLGKASTKSLANFFNAYMDKDTDKFSHGNEADKNALENFFRVDGWRNVSDGVWTKIVKVSELNTGGAK